MTEIQLLMNAASKHRQVRLFRLLTRDTVSAVFNYNTLLGCMYDSIQLLYQPEKRCK